MSGSRRATMRRSHTEAAETEKHSSITMHTCRQQPSSTLNHHTDNKHIPSSAPVPSIPLLSPPTAVAPGRIRIHSCARRFSAFSFIITHQHSESTDGIGMLINWSQRAVCSMHLRCVVLCRPLRTTPMPPRWIRESAHTQHDEIIPHPDLIPSHHWLGLPVRLLIVPRITSI